MLNWGERNCSDLKRQRGYSTDDCTFWPLHYCNSCIKIMARTAKSTYLVLCHTLLKITTVAPLALTSSHVVYDSCQRQRVYGKCSSPFQNVCFLYWNLYACVLKFGGCWNNSNFVVTCKMCSYCSVQATMIVMSTCCVLYHNLITSTNPSCCIRVNQLCTAATRIP